MRFLLTLSLINSSLSLTQLDLYGNNLVIPSIHQWLLNITENIRVLSLSDNSLQHSTLADFENMISLETLYLSNATLEGDIPKSFGNKMCRLERLDLSYNNFSLQLPDLIQNLSGCIQTSLQHLYLKGNQITGSLPDLTRFASLRRLSLRNNRLNGTLDKSIGHMSNLEELYLGWNLLNGVISQDHFSNMSNLSSLELAGNSFVWNISLNWVPPFRLTIIRLQSCKMGPHFPRWLRYQKNYGELDISNNEIFDFVPKWFWELSFEFENLNISHNNLRGRVPNLSLKFMIAELSFIDISFNCFSGPLPLISSKLDSTYYPRRFKLSNGDSLSGTLIVLDLSNNKFSGVLGDPFFINIQDLVFMNLANNNLSGQIPTSIGLHSELVSLNLENNAFSGELPSSLKNCSRLRFLDFSGNKLSGNIPIWIGKSLTSMQFLRLRYNEFHGNIPWQLCRLRNVQILDLSFNYLNGSIPRCFQNLTAMTNHNSTKTIGIFYSYFVKADLTPTQLYKDKAMVLWKGRNYVCDENLGQFQIIDLSGNNIDGEIPKELTSLLELQQLNLSNNKLTGAVPQEIGFLKQLESLDLSQNKLSGRLPDSIASLNFLDTLDLSYNDFSGRIPSGPQLQTFTASAFAGNPALCGLPLTQNCPGEDVNQFARPDTDSQQNEEDGDDFLKWLYAGMGLGFIVGFCGVSGTLLLMRSWRHSYFQLLDKSVDWLHVRIAVYGRRLQRKFHI